LNLKQPLLILLALLQNPALGTVVMATEYNVYNPLFASKQQMENYEWATSCKPSCSMLHEIETAKKETPVHTMYVTGANNLTQLGTTVGDARLYFLGLFALAVTGMQSAGFNIGELWVSYEIELKKPRIQTGQTPETQNGANMDHIQIYTATKQPAGVLPGTPFGTATTAALNGILFPTSGSSLGGICSGGIVPIAGAFTGVPVLTNGTSGTATGALGPSAANTYYFNPGISSGNYLFSYNALYGTAGTQSTTAIAIGNGVATTFLFDSDTLSVLTNTTSANSSTNMINFIVTVTAANCSVILTGSGSTTNPTWADLFVIELPKFIN